MDLGDEFVGPADHDGAGVEIALGAVPFVPKPGESEPVVTSAVK